MDVLMLGGTGNISAEVVDLLVKRSHRVTIVTRGSGPIPPGCAHIRADVRDRDGYGRALKDYRGDVAINFLGLTPGHCENDYAVLKGKISQYVFISSTVVYEKPHTTLPLTEDMKQGNRFSTYARDKIACEAYLGEVQGPDFPVTIVRPSHTFGPTWIPSPLNGADYTLATRILAGKPIVLHDTGQSLWTLTAASDFAAGLAGLLGNQKAFGEAFHITSDQALTWNVICFEIGLALGRQPEIVHIPTEFLVDIFPIASDKLRGDKAEHGVFDNAKIKRFVPDFECQKSFRAAIRQSVEWCNADPSRKKPDPEQDTLVESWIAAWRGSGEAGWQDTAESR